VALDFHRVLGEYLYRGTMRAYAQAASTWRYNGARRNHFVASFLRRVMTTRIPGAMPPAGRDGEASQWPFTWMPWLWHVEFLLPAAEALGDPEAWRGGVTPAAARRRSRLTGRRASASPRRDAAPLVDVFRTLSASFLRCARDRPVLLVDALVWRERAVVVDAACGYSGDGAALAVGGSSAAARRMAEEEAIEEARRNAEDARRDEEESDADADEMTFDADPQPTAAAQASSSSSSSSSSVAAAARPAPAGPRTPSARPWSPAEDATLRLLWRELGTMPSAAHAVASTAGTAGGVGAGRTAEQVRARATFLELPTAADALAPVPDAADAVLGMPGGRERAVQVARLLAAAAEAARAADAATASHALLLRSVLGEAAAAALLPALPGPSSTSRPAAGRDAAFPAMTTWGPGGEWMREEGARGALLALCVRQPRAEAGEVWCRVHGDAVTLDAVRGALQAAAGIGEEELEAQVEAAAEAEAADAGGASPAASEPADQAHDEEAAAPGSPAASEPAAEAGEEDEAAATPPSRRAGKRGRPEGAGEEATGTSGAAASPSQSPGKRGRAGQGPGDVSPSASDPGSDEEDALGMSQVI